MCSTNIIRGHETFARYVDRKGSTKHAKFTQVEKGTFALSSDSVLIAFLSSFERDINVSCTKRKNLTVFAS